MLRRARAHAGVWDFIVVGGGATGVGIDDEEPCELQ